MVRLGGYSPLRQSTTPIATKSVPSHPCPNVPTLDVRQKNYTQCDDFIRLIGYPVDCQGSVCGFYGEWGSVYSVADVDLFVASKIIGQHRQQNILSYALRY